MQNNPGAETYRNRTFVNFNDVCIIYAYTQADGRYSLSSHDVDLDDDVQAVATGGLSLHLNCFLFVLG